MFSEIWFSVDRELSNTLHIYQPGPQREIVLTSGKRLGAPAVQGFFPFLFLPEFGLTKHSQEINQRRQYFPALGRGYWSAVSSPISSLLQNAGK